MADAIPSGLGKDKPVKDVVKEEKKVQKDIVEMPKAQSKTTLPDGTVVETF
jgi:hypothetical protein